MAVYLTLGTILFLIDLQSAIAIYPNRPEEICYIGQAKVRTNSDDVKWGVSGFGESICECARIEEGGGISWFNNRAEMKARFWFPHDDLFSFTGPEAEPVWRQDCGPSKDATPDPKYSGTTAKGSGDGDVSEGKETTKASGAMGGGETTKASGEQGGEATKASGEHGGETTKASGEHGGETTKGSGEQGGETTKASGEQGGETTTASGEQGGETTKASGEQGGEITTEAGGAMGGETTTEAGGAMGGETTTEAGKPTTEAPEPVWQLVYTATAGTSIPDPFLLWTSMSESADVPRDVGGAVAQAEPHYLNSTVDGWGDMNIKYVKLAVYDDTDNELIFLTFNGTGSSRFDWMSKERLINSPYTDIMTNDGITYFSVNGYPEEESPNFPPDDIRRFLIQENAMDTRTECAQISESAWFMMMSTRRCESMYAGAHMPLILYSKGNIKATWNQEADVGSAASMKIYIKVYPPETTDPATTTASQPEGTGGCTGGEELCDD